MENNSNLIIYTTEDGLTKVDVTFEEGELKQELTMRKFGNSEFSTKPTNHYNLDVLM